MAEIQFLGSGEDQKMKAGKPTAEPAPKKSPVKKAAKK